MWSFTRPLLLSFALVVALLGVAENRPVCAQNVGYVTPADPDGIPINVRKVEVLTGLNDRAGYGYIGFEVTNDNDEDHEVTIRLSSPGSGVPFSAERTLLVPVGSARAMTLPLPGFADFLQCEIRVDGSVWGRTSVGYSSSSNLIVLAVGFAQHDRSSGWGRAYEALSGQGIYDVAVSHVEPSDLPERWSDLSVVDLIAVNGLDPDLQPHHQKLLADFVAGGGRLVCWGRKSLSPGALRDFAVDPFRVNSSVGFEQYGFGFWADGDRKHGIVPLLLNLRGPGEYTAALPEFANEPVPLGGIGDIPVRSFVLLILAFVVIVGPVNYLFFRRRKQPLKAFLVAPVIGLALTGSIIVYGLVGDGLGVRRSSYSLTLLNQRTHEAFTAAQQTFYAGLSPRDGLTLEAGTLLLPATPDGDLKAPYDVRLDEGMWIGGGALPSRSETAYTLVSRKRCRARLRFRRVDEERAGYEALPDSALIPREGAGMLVLRDFAGRYYTRADKGHLMAVNEATGLHAFRSLVAGLEAARRAANAAASLRAVRPQLLRARRHRWRGPVMTKPNGVQIASWLQVRLGSVELPLGSYAAVVEASPGLDDLGLTAQMVDGYEIVVGALAEEDLLD